MTVKKSRRSLLRVAAKAGALGIAALPAIAAIASKARANTGSSGTDTEAVVHARFVTSWPKGSPGPGISADRLAARIEKMSAGSLKVTVYGAGELVPPLEVFDAVGTGAAEMAHTASLFWGGKAAAAPLFTAGPFGLTAVEHHAWIYHGGGQALWDALYQPFNLKPLIAGNTGMQMGGWFNKEIKSLDDLKGLKVRMPGLGGAVLERLGGSPITLPPGEIFSALQTGLVDGAEFLGPWSDRAFGFYKVAKFYYAPGYHEPNGTGEALFNLTWWQSLSERHREIISNACAAEASISLAESEWHNARALKQLTEQDGVQLRTWPDDVLKAARDASGHVLDRVAESSDLSGKIIASYRLARDQAADWGRTGYEAYYRARGL